MRWQGLFDDLEGQWAAEERRDREAEVADRTRAERARVALLDRCAASRGSRLVLWSVTGEPLEGTLVDLGADWLLLRELAGRELLVAATAVTSISGLSRSSDPAVTARRFAIGYALRALSRDRAAVVVTDRSGGRVSGTIDAVGQDWFDLAEHPVDEPRRAGAVTGRRTVAVSALVSVLSATSSPPDDGY
jgi:hypothetical protein